MMLLSAEKTKLSLKAKLFHGFSDTSRLSILEALRTSPKTVSDIVTATKLTQSNVSNHLSCLRDCGLVVAEQEGRYMKYRLSDDRVAALLELADVLLADVARSIYECTRYDTPSIETHQQTE